MGVMPSLATCHACELFCCMILLFLFAGPKKPFLCPTDELLRAKDDLLSEEGQSLSSLTAQVVR